MESSHFHEVVNLYCKMKCDYEDAIEALRVAHRLILHGGEPEIDKIASVLHKADKQ